ncbi:MAG: hypothetical protein ACT4OK_00960 [Gemmobacter sp.]
MKLRLIAGMALCATLAACAAAPRGPEVGRSAPVIVTGADLPFSLADGAAAKQVADAQCRPNGVRTSIYDSFDAARSAWVYPEGCA